MNDELDRIRSLRGDAPAPSDEWVQDTHAELLAMAAEEEQERRATAASSLLTRFGERLAALVAPVAFDRAIDPAPAARETSRTETTVAGRDAVVVEWTSTGAAAMPMPQLPPGCSSEPYSSVRSPWLWSWR